jgi:hypothetical protein
MCDDVTIFLRTTAMSKTRHHRHGLSRIKVFAGCRCFFKKPLLPLGERKTCLQVAFLIGSPVKSAFALLCKSNRTPATPDKERM